MNAGSQSATPAAIAAKFFSAARAGQGGADAHADRSDLVLALDRHASGLRQLAHHQHEDLRSRGVPLSDLSQRLGRWKWQCAARPGGRHITAGRPTSRGAPAVSTAASELSRRELSSLRGAVRVLSASLCPLVSHASHCSTMGRTTCTMTSITKWERIAASRPRRM
jgi:hypothetical protein